MNLRTRFPDDLNSCRLDTEQTDGLIATVRRR
jgi:hypothetical protein